MQESRVQRTGKEDMRNQVGKNGEKQESRKTERHHLKEATVRRSREERGKEETEAK